MILEPCEHLVIFSLSIILLFLIRPELPGCVLGCCIQCTLLQSESLDYFRSDNGKLAGKPYLGLLENLLKNSFLSAEPLAFFSKGIRI